MVRVAVVTDSTADLPAEVVERLGVSVVPLNVHFGDEVFRDRVDLSTEEFMERLQRERGALPTTSQPAAGVFEETFRHLAADHDAIVAVLISSKLSGTAMSAGIARDAAAGLIPVEIVDSLNASMGLGFQVIRAAELAAQGLEAVEIARRLRAATGSFHLIFAVDTLEYLQRGGRIGRASALLGSLLSIKPLLRVDEGQVVPHERTRTRAKAIQGLVDYARGLPKVQRLAVLHSTTPDLAEDIASRFGTLLPRDEIFITQFSPVLGTHVGPGAVGVAVDEGEAG